MMPHFAEPRYFAYLWWLPLGLALMALYHLWRSKKIGALADARLIRTLFPKWNKRAYLVTGGVLLLASALIIIIALANPVGASRIKTSTRSGMDIVIALDVSKSMDAQDIKPSRLQRSVQFIKDLGAKLEGNRIGLVIFARNAYVQMPLNSDVDALKLFLDNISTDMLADQGTSLGDAIETSKELLNPEGEAPGKRAKAIVLISDGENHEDNAITAATDAANAGVLIYTVAAGTPDGAPVPLYNDDIVAGYLKDEAGETVVSKTDETMLQQIATGAQGSFYRMGENGDAHNKLAAQLNSLAKGEIGVQLYNVHETRFQWLAGLAIILLLLDAALETRIKMKSAAHENH